MPEQARPTGRKRRTRVGGVFGAGRTKLGHLARAVVNRQTNEIQFATSQRDPYLGGAKGTRTPALTR